jgi:RNA polymerase sigma-70 factor (sigma-E family)
VREDQRTGFEAFVRLEAGRLLRTAIALTGHPHDAEDLLQVALERVARRWGRGAELDPSAYCRTVLARLAVDRWRAVQRRPGLVLTALVPERAALPAADVDLSGDLLAALRDLPARQRAVVALRYLEDLSEQETAAALGIAVGTVKSQASKGLARLRAAAATGVHEGAQP